MIVLRFLGALALTLPIAARAEPPRVVADIAPVHSLVARVMEGVGEPALLMPPGTSPHDHALRPSEARSLADAEMVVIVGAALAPQIVRAAERLAPDAERLTLDAVPGTVSLPAREDPLLDGHGHEEGEHGTDHDGGHGHDHGDVDPHAWLDPANGRVWLGALADALSALDPPNARAYRANAEAGRAELTALEAEIEAELESFRGTRYVVLHDAFQYFGARFDVPATAALSIGDASDPGPARLREIADALASERADCAFAEPQLDPGLIDVVAEGVPVARLDPLGASLELGPGLYPALLSDLARAMTGCRDGS